MTNPRIVTEQEIKDFLELKEAKLRHLINIRNRYIDYALKGKKPTKRTVNGIVNIERLYNKLNQERM